MSVEALYEAQPPLLLSRLSISWVHEFYQDKQRRSTVQSYISKREVKTLGAVGLGWRECGVWNVAPLRFKSLSQLFLSFSANGKKKEKKICSHVVESHTAFISWRLWPTSHWFSNKKKCFFYISTGSNGSSKMCFFFSSSLADRCCFCCKWHKPAHLCSFHAAPAMQLCWKISFFVYTMWSPKCVYADVLKLFVHY